MIGEKIPLSQPWERACGEGRIVFGIQFRELPSQRSRSDAMYTRS